jgi:N,N'-diacetyllegionaminate synthase
MKSAFGLPVGYSDHTMGIEIPIAAAALGASIIEKHFTLDRNMKGPDHMASIEPEELKAMVKAVRNVEMALGDGIKRPVESEEDTRLIARKSLVAARDIKKGFLFTEENVTAKRPGNGMMPSEWDKVLGKKAKRYFKKDETIEI